MHICIPIPLEMLDLNWMLITCWKVSLLFSPEDTNQSVISNKNVKFGSDDGWALFVTYTIIQSKMCSLHLSVHTWSSGQPTVQRLGSSRGLPVGAGIRTHNLGLPRVSSPTLYPLGQRLPLESWNRLTMEHFSTLKQFILNEPRPTGYDGASGPCSHMASFLQDRALVCICRWHSTLCLPTVVSESILGPI